LGYSNTSDAQVVKVCFVLLQATFLDLFVGPICGFCQPHLVVDLDLQHVKILKQHN
jgi:hypothetical protein